MKKNLKSKSKYEVLSKKVNSSGITLIALIITIIISYDEILKFSNSKGFLLKEI